MSQPEDLFEKKKISPSRFFLGCELNKLWMRDVGYATCVGQIGHSIE